jgi:hypothetical protein
MKVKNPGYIVRAGWSKNYPGGDVEKTAAVGGVNTGNA